MAQTVSIIVSPEDQVRLAELRPVLEVTRDIGISRPAVWRWQLGYAEQGVDGLRRDKTASPPCPWKR